MISLWANKKTLAAYAKALGNSYVHFLNNNRKAHTFLFHFACDFKVADDVVELVEKLQFLFSTDDHVRHLNADNDCASLQRIIMDFQFIIREKLVHNFKRSHHFPCSERILDEYLFFFKMLLELTEDFVEVFIVQVQFLLFPCGVAFIVSLWGIGFPFRANFRFPLVGVLIYE